MPAASWPRCCKACSPSAVMAAASGWPKMPNTPHSSRSRSESGSNKPWSAAGASAVISMHRSFDPRQFAMLIGRTLRRLILFRSRPLQLLQDGGLRVFRQQRYEPLAGSGEDDARLGAFDPFGLASIGDEPGEKHEGDHDDGEPPRQPEQKAERTIERTDTTVEHHVGNPDRHYRNHQQRNQEYAADYDDRGDDIVVEVLLGERQQLAIRVKRRAGS